MKEFKIGDKVYIECNVVSINVNENYPILVSTEGGMQLSFTKDGRFEKSDSISVLKHIEDITPKPELPKWMMVSDDGKEWDKRFVVYKDSHAVVTCYSGETSTTNGVVRWKYAKEIEPENTKLQKLEIKYKELGEEIEKLKNK